jgi:hypothetical protein
VKLWRFLRLNPLTDIFSTLTISQIESRHSRRSKYKKLSLAHGSSSSVGRSDGRALSKARVVPLRDVVSRDRQMASGNMQLASCRHIIVFLKPVWKSHNTRITARRPESPALDAAQRGPIYMHSLHCVLRFGRTI